MANSISDIRVGREWISINAAAIALGGEGFAVGDPIHIQKKRDVGVLLWEGEEPTSASMGGRALTKFEPSVSYKSGSDEIWAKSAGFVSAYIHVSQGVA